MATGSRCEPNEEWAPGVEPQHDATTTNSSTTMHYCHRGEGILLEEGDAILSAATCGQGREARESKSVQVVATRVPPTLHPLTPEADATNATRNHIQMNIHAWQSCMVVIVDI